MVLLMKKLFFHYYFQLSLSEMGVIPGSTALSSPVVPLAVTDGFSGELKGAEVFSTEIASLKTSSCYYRDVSYQVVMPNPDNFIPDLLGYVRNNVCPNADPWDHLRLYISVCIPKSVFGIF